MVSILFEPGSIVAAVKAFYQCAAAESSTEIAGPQQLSHSHTTESFLFPEV